MGSPTPEQENRPSFKEEVQHEVTISKPFYIGVTHVTVAQYAQFARDTKRKQNEAKFKQGGDHPAVQVSWDDAEAFCQWLSKKSGKTVALPTEAQWEYACRAGTQTRFCFGDKAAPLVDYSWYSVNSGGMTHPVAKKKPNAWGLYDMHGNAWHWCADYYGPYVVADKTDPTGPKDGQPPRATWLFLDGRWSSKLPLGVPQRRRSLDPGRLDRLPRGGRGRHGLIILQLIKK